MKASEIMINDLIYVYGQNGNILAEPHWYVRQVTADWLVDMVKNESNNKKLKDYGVVIPEQQSFIGDTKPIPLTEDILKVNGFKFSAETGVIRYVYLTPDDSVFVEPMKVESRLGKTWFWFENGRRDLDVIRPKCFIPFTYVHELQHALRLCGLNELAENFKVE